MTSRSAEHARDQLRPLLDAGFNIVERYDIDQRTSEMDRVNALAGVWAVIAGSEPYGRSVFDKVGGSLHILARPGTGYDAIDVDSATNAGVLVFTTPGVNKEAVADFAVALMLGCLRRLVDLDQEVRSGHWRSGWPARDLHQATVGIVGLGAVGRTVATRLLGFDCRILGTDPQADRQACESLGIKLLSLSELLSQVDVLTLHVALTPTTRHLIGAPELEAMHPRAILVNTSRGPVVDQAALVSALRLGRISGAALDVFEHEPLPPDDPLTKLPNVLLSSHVASHTVRSMQAMVGAVAAGIIDATAGRPPAGSLNPSVMQSTKWLEAIWTE